MNSNSPKMLGEHGNSAGVIGDQSARDPIAQENVKVRTDEGKNEIPPSFYKFPPCTEFFHGRDEVLRKVEEAIVLSEEKETFHERVVVIFGLEGMGKSEVAKVVAKRLQSNYDYICWFDAQTRKTLDFDFETLAAVLKIPLHYDHNVRSTLADIYQCLAQNYRKGIFIFENAEALRAQDGKFGLEEYLLPDLYCKKPVFLITSLNPWGCKQGRIPCIELDRLSDEESHQCLLKYMGLQNQILPKSLEETITSLAHRLEGYPLLLSLLGLAFADTADEISWTTIESRVKSYIELLEDQGLKEVCGVSRQDERLQIIFNATVNAMEATAEGRIAVELLNIIALLAPVNINAGLVNGIYCGKPFEQHCLLCPRFVWDDLEATVSSGLKLLMATSLLRKENVARPFYTNMNSFLYNYSWSYFGNFDYYGEYDMIKIHSLIHKSAQNRLLSTKEYEDPFEKIIGLCERSELPREHTHHLLKFSMQNGLYHLETSYLQILSMQLNWKEAEDCYLLDDVIDFLRTQRLSSDSDKALYLLKLLNQEDGIMTSQLSQLRSSVFGFSPEFAKRYWVLQLCINVMPISPRGDGMYDDLHYWLKQNYTDSRQSVHRRFHRILHLPVCLEDQEFVSKVFACTSEHQRGVFWCLMGSITHNNDTNTEWLEQAFSHSDISIFSSSLQFSQDSFKYYFLEEWARYFCEWVTCVAICPELRTSLLANNGFVDSFWDVTNFSFKHVSLPSVSGYWKPCKERMEQGLARLIGTWCFLFRYDAALYDRFGGKLDSEVHDWLPKRHRVYRDSNPAPFWSFEKHKNHIRNFLDAAHCSGPTRNWIQKMLKEKI